MGEEAHIVAGEVRRDTVGDEAQGGRDPEQEGKSTKEVLDELRA